MKSSFKKKGNILGKASCITILVLLLTLCSLMPIVNAAPSPVYGTAIKSGGSLGSADGAYVKVASSLGTVDTYVGSEGGWESGYWMVDVGDPGPNWPDGTSFTVTITLNGTDWYSTSYSGTVRENGTNIGAITLTDHDTGGGSPGGGGGSPGPSNKQPTANPNGPYTGYANSSIVFDGTGSSDEDGSIVSYSWSFGDGSNGNGSTPSHTYDTPGNYTVSLTVEDDNGATDTHNTFALISAEPEGEAPTAEITAPSQSIANQTITFSGEGSADSDGTITDYTWTFDDGTIGHGKTINHVYTIPNTYVVTLTVTDDDGKTDTTLKTVTILEAEPIDVPDGYVVDSNDDGEPDDFYNAETGQTSKMQKQDDGTYLIDTDNDGIWDKIYDPASGTVETYEPTEEEPDEGFPLWGIAIIIIVIILIVIGLLFYTGILYIEHEE